MQARDISADESSKVKLDDLTDAASEETDRSVSWVTASATQDSLFEVTGAIERIERGTYGICELTGQPIEPERLAAIPWARYSLAGQRELEQLGGGHRLALPALEPLNQNSGESDGAENEAEEEMA